MDSKKSTNYDFILKTSIERYYDLLKNAEKDSSIKLYSYK